MSITDKQPKLTDFLVLFPDLGDGAKNRRTRTTPEGRGKLPPANAEQILGGCGWLRHCRDEARSLSEIDWYHMLSIVSRCENGRELAHTFSKGHPGYSPEQTDEKFDHALRASEPVTCETVKTKGCGKYCGDCGFGRRNNYERSCVLLGTKLGKDDFKPSDLGNARLFASRYIDTMRFDTKSGKWLMWNGRHWKRDEHGEAMLKVHELIKSLYDEEPDWAFKCEDRARVNAILPLAAPLMAIDVNELDTHKHLLVCRNGTVNCITEELTPHDPKLLITQYCDVDFYPGMKSEVWDNFLQQFTGGNAELLSFLQVAMGYCVTGETREEVFFLIYGSGGSGKGTFCDSIRRVIGDNYQTADQTSFIKGDKNIRNDLAGLKGARVVVTNETNDGAQLDAGVVKTMTGRDQIKVRFLHQEYFSFVPEFKPIFCTNFKPKLRGDDTGIIRRLVPMAFNSAPALPDKLLKDRMAESDVQGAIFAWLIAGAARWYREGLVKPRCVIEEAEKYRIESDPLARWMTEHIVRDPDGVAPVALIRRSYEEFARDFAEDPISPIGFNKMLEGRGFQRGTARVEGIVAKCWLGMRFRTPEDDA